MVLACSLVALAALAWIGRDATLDVEAIPPGGAPCDPAAPAGASLDHGTGAGTAADASGQRLAAAQDRAAGSTAKARPQVPHEHQLVLVVDPEGHPVADADVAAEDYHAPRLTAAQLRLHDRLVGFEQLEVGGQRTHTDEDGFAVLRGGDSLWLAARKGDLYAFATLRPDAVGNAPMVVRMEREQSVAVRVVDARGEGIAGVPVVFTAKYPPVPGWNAVMTMDVGCTDPEGRLNARHLQELSRHLAPSHVVARVDCPGLAATETAVAADATSVSLVVASFGSVRIRLLDRDGDPVADDPACRVWLTGGDTQQRATADHGACVFPCVGLGVPLQVMADCQGHRLAQAIEALRQHGQLATAVLRLSATDLASVHGRLRDVGGAALAGQQITLHGCGNTVYAATDGEGRFHVHAALADSVAREGRLVLESATGAKLQSPPLLLQRGVDRDCGDLTLTAGSSLCSGLIVGHRPPDFRLDVHQLVDGDWLWTDGCSTDVAADGSFTVSTADPDMLRRTLRLQVCAPGCLPIAPIEFRQGQQGLRIALEPGLGIEARVLVDPWVLHVLDDYGSAMLERPDGTRSELACCSDTDSLRCTSKSLAPGRYSLVLGGELELLRIDGIDIGPGCAPDSRLDPIDLRGRLQMLTIHAVDAEGQPVESEAETYYRAAGAKDWQPSWQALGGAGHLCLRQNYDVCILTDDHAPVTCVASTDRLDVVLPRMRERSVILEGLPELAPNAPIDVRIVAPPDWAAQRRLPPGADPVRRSTFDAAAWKLTCCVAEELDAFVEIELAGPRHETLPPIPVHFGSDALVRVAAPAEIRTRLLRFAKPAK